VFLGGFVVGLVRLPVVDEEEEVFGVAFFEPADGFVGDLGGGSSLETEAGGPYLMPAAKKPGAGVEDVADGRRSK